MNTEFRTKLRVKRWNYPEILKRLLNRQTSAPAVIPNSIPNNPYYQVSNRCARCGLDWAKGPMGYCCPHGNLCGFPHAPPISVPTVFIPQFQAVSQASMQSKADVWN